MVFEWDAKKSASNKVKHGLSFEEVEEALVLSPPLDSFKNPAHPSQQIFVFRSLDGKICTVAVERRQNAFRIISAHENRKMRKKYGP